MKNTLTRQYLKKKKKKKTRTSSEEGTVSGTTPIRLNIAYSIGWSEWKRK
jgi:hypothetical protein